MPPQSVVQESHLPPPYGVDTQPGCQDPDLLLVPLEMIPVPPQETGWPPPYTGDTQTCSQGPDLLLVPLEATPISPQEIDLPPPYHQISTTESDMWSLHDGDQPPPYSTCTEQQVRVKYFGSLFRKLINTLPFKVDLVTKFGTFFLSFYITSSRIKVDYRLFIVQLIVTCTQGAQKVLSNSSGLVDFAIGRVIFVLNLPDRQVLFFGEIQITQQL